MVTKRIYFRILALACFSLVYLKGNSQTPGEKFNELKKAINSVNPEIDFFDRIVLISVWKSTDFESREANKETYRVYKIYEHAKLKNGEKGAVFISINLDEDNQTKEFAISKDEINPGTVLYDARVLEVLKKEYEIGSSKDNILIDKAGTVHFMNIPKDQIFPSVRNLITR